MFAVKGRWILRIESAAHCVLRVVEPEAHMKGIRWFQAYVDIRVEPKNLIQQDRLDANMSFVSALGNLDVRLIPRQPEALVELRREVRVRCVLGQQRAA